MINKEDLLLTECSDMCKKIGVRCTSIGEPIKWEIRKAVWGENDNDTQ